MAAGRPSSGVLLIGNELLSGRVPDANLAYLARRLWELGTPVARAEMCGDDPAEIAVAVARLAAGCSWVFTSGGIGPTHDDVTMEGVARAFGVPVIVEPTLERLIREHFGDACQAAHLRMARAPEGARLEGEDAGWPTVRMRNVFVLPGVPAILQRKFERLAEQFRQPPLHRATLAFRADEALLAARLERAAQDWPRVSIGSYPQPDSVLVTFEGELAAEVEGARNDVRQATADIPPAD